MTEPWETRWVDYYELLEVHPRAQVRRIKKAYFNLVQEHHPDHGGDEQRTRLLNEAWEVLSDPARRTLYDEAHRSRAPARDKPQFSPPPAHRYPVGDVEVVGEVRFVRFQREPGSDFLITDLTMAGALYGRQEVHFVAAYVGSSGLGERVEVNRGDQVGLRALFQQDGTFEPLTLRNCTTGLSYRLVTSFEPLPRGLVECSGVVRRARIKGQYGNDWKEVELAIASPRYGTCQFQFSALWGSVLAATWLEIGRADHVTLVFENGDSFRPVRFDNHTRGVSYKLNSGWAMTLSLLDALGNIGRAFRR